MQVADGDLQTLVERVEDRRFPHPAVADQRAGLALHRAAERVEPFPVARGAGDDRHVERVVHLERRELGRPILGRDEIDLVDADQRLRAAALDGDEIAIDQPRAQRRLAHRHHMNDHVDVRSDEALAVRVERIGAREHRSPRQNLDQTANSVRRLRDDAVADRYRAFLPGRDLGRDNAIELAAVVEDAAASAGDADHHCGIVDVDVAGAGVPEIISHCLHPV